MIAARLSFAAALLCAAVATSAVSTSAVAETAPGDVKIVDGEIAQSLTGAPGNAADGRKAFVDRKLGNCLACHANSETSEQQFHGEVGPTLDGVGERWTAEQLRAILVDSKEVFGAQTVMPGFYSLNVGVDVRKDLIGKTILTAEQIEAIVAYLVTLK
jgi:L-cysteine S-thiosulfotransferase